MSDLFDDEFGFEPLPVPETTGRTTGSPVVFLGAAAIALAAGTATFVNSCLSVQIVGYVLASVVCFMLVAWARRRAVAQLFRSGIAPPRSDSLAAVGLLMLGFATSVLHAWLIARHFR